MALMAVTSIAVHFDAFQARLPAFHEFFGPQSWLLLGAVLAVTKVLHELGHAYACKRFGGECHEIGILLLVFTPCMYCDVSDSWLLPSKWKRAAIGAAGIYVETVLASLATFFWWHSDPGLFNFVCLQVMFICSVSTLLFNGNPLMRFDGYYIVSDLLEMPNLQQKAGVVLKRITSRWCLGLKQQDDPFLPQRCRLLFAAYTVGSFAYRWVIVFSILIFLCNVFEPYGLQAIGYTLAVFSMASMVGRPLWQLVKFVRV
ncbi:unnamed protein product, partial [marine sediment metagenome]